MNKKGLASGMALLFGLNAVAVEVSSDTTLEQVTDWRGQGAVTVAEGVTLDLGGHKLLADGLGGSGTVLGSAGATYRFFRFKIDDTRGAFAQISELKLYNGETDVTQSHVNLYYDDETLTSDGKKFGSGETPENAVDGNMGNKWLDFRSTPSESLAVRAAAWLTLEFIEPICVTSYEWYTGDTSWCKERNPKSWRLQGSDDNASWVDLDVQVDRTDVTTADWKCAYTGSPVSPDAISELHFDVAAGDTVRVTDTTLAGRLRVVKEGAGELVLAKSGQTYMDGTLVSAGTVALEAGVDNAYGAGTQRVTVGPDGVFDARGVAGLGGVELVLAGGTLRSTVAMDLSAAGAAPTLLTDDSFAEFAEDFVWGGKTTDLGGKTLSATLPEDCTLAMKGDAMSNGTFAIGGNGALQVAETCNLTNVNLDAACVLDIRAQLSVSDFTVRSSATVAEGANGRVKVFGTYCPVATTLPGVDLQDGAVLDLSQQTGVWDFGSCAVADQANVTIKLAGRTLTKGEKVVGWAHFPSNYATLTLAYDDPSVALVATSEGLFYGAEEGSVVVTAAQWTGDAGDGDVSNYENWNCQNAGGETISYVLPGADAYVTIGGANLKINLSEGSGFVCGTLVLTDSTLAGDCDLSGAIVDVGTARIDLNGYTLTLAKVNGIGEVTDAVGSGVLRMVVPAETELVNARMAMTGSMKLVKDGAGTLVAARAGQTYAGGTEVLGGVLRQGLAEIECPFGASSARVVVKNGGTFDARGCTSGVLTELVADGGTVLLASTGSTEAPNFEDFTLNGDAKLLAANEIQLTEAKGYQRGTAFWNKRVNPASPWRASFTYKTVKIGDPADGFAFVLHNDTRGVNAIGDSGGSIAANGITPSFGCAYTIYGGDSAGWIVDGEKIEKTYVGDEFIDNGVSVVVEYDGLGIVRQTITSPDGVKSFEHTVDLAAKLGTSAWIGFTAACGGSNCDQRIVDFTFEAVHDVALDMSPTADVWKLNKNADILIREEIGTGIQLTPAQGMSHGSAVLRNKVNLKDEFRISGTYRVLDGGDSPADGAAFVFHNDSIEGCGDNGGSRGFHGGDPGLSTCVGWAFNILKDSKLEAVQEAEVTESYDLAESGISFKSGLPVDFVLTYQDGALTMDLLQMVEGVEHRYSATQTVDLAARFGTSTAYFAMTGGTGGLFGLQCVYDLRYESLMQRVAGYGALDVATDSAVELEQTVADGVMLNALELSDDSTLTVRATGPSDLNYAVAVETLKVFDPAGSTLVLAPNGSGVGTLELGSIESTSGVGAVKVAGNVAALPGKKILIKMPVFSGRVELLDLSGATYALTAEDFELETEMKEPNRIRLSKNGILSVTHGESFAIILR